MYCQIRNRFKQPVENKGQQFLIAAQKSKQFKGSLTETKDLVAMTGFESAAQSKIQVGEVREPRGGAVLKIKGFSEFLSYGRPFSFELFE